MILDAVVSAEGRKRGNSSCAYIHNLVGRVPADGVFNVSSSPCAIFANMSAGQRELLD